MTLQGTSSIRESAADALKEMWGRERVMKNGYAPVKLCYADENTTSYSADDGLRSSSDKAPEDC